MLLTLTLLNQTNKLLLSLCKPFTLLSVYFTKSFNLLFTLIYNFSFHCISIKHQAPIAASASVSASFFHFIFSLNHYISLTKSLPYLVVTWIYTLHYDRWACIQWRVKIHFDIFKWVKCTCKVYQHSNTNEIDKTTHWL